jgi:hypothetical protein
MSLLEILMIEDFCDAVEGKNKKNKAEGNSTGCGTIIGFIIMVVAFAWIREILAQKFEQYLLHLGLVVLMFTVFIPVLVKSKHIAIAKLLQIANIAVGFIFFSVLIADFMDGAPFSNLVKGNMHFAETISIGILKSLGKLILWVLTPVAIVIDAVVLPLFAVPFVQRLIWKSLRVIKV